MEDGVDIYCFRYMNKFVSGSYGMEKDEIVKVDIVSWSKGGIRSDILQMDGALSPKVLVDMAKEAITEKYYYKILCSTLPCIFSKALANYVHIMYN